MGHVPASAMSLLYLGVVLCVLLSDGQSVRAAARRASHASADAMGRRLAGPLSGRERTKSAAARSLKPVPESTRYLAAQGVEADLDPIPSADHSASHPCVQPSVHDSLEMRARRRRGEKLKQWMREKSAGTRLQLARDSRRSARLARSRHHKGAQRLLGRRARLAGVKASSAAAVPSPSLPPVSSKANSSRPIFVYPQDAAVLLGFREAINASEGLASWNAAKPCDRWAGVECDTSGRVVRFDSDQLDFFFDGIGGEIPADFWSLPSLEHLQYLSLKAFGLYGPLPPSIGNLTSLLSLDLSFNTGLSGSLPSTIGKLTGLQELVLDVTGLAGSLPSSIGNMIGLQNVLITNTKFTGTLPSSIGNLVQLQALFLRETGLSGSLPSTIGNLVGLRNLFIGQNSLSGSIPFSIGRLIQLQYLSLKERQLSGSLPSSIGDLTGLTAMVILSPISGSLPSSIGSLTGLERTWISGRLEGSIPSSIGNLTRLTSLYLAYNHLSGSLPSTIANLTGFIYLDSNRLSGSIPSSICNFGGAINLSGNKLSGPLPPCISSVTNGLELLDVSSNRLTGSLPPSTSQSRWPASLAVYSNRLSGPLPPSLGNASGLKILYLGSNKISGSLPSSIGDLPGLLSLDLSNNQLSGSIPSSISKLRRTLLGLDLSSNQLTGYLPKGFDTEQWDVSDNFLSGSCPKNNQDSTNYISGNCFRGCPEDSNINSRPLKECAQACGSDQASGPCLGHGTCFLKGVRKAPVCVCNPGFVSLSSSPGTCVTPPPPPPPGYAVKPCAGAVPIFKRCKCPAGARCVRKRACGRKFVCRCVGAKKTPVTDPKTGLLKLCI